jgi:hypoxanthine phosphoribosyltransferase
MAAYGHRPLSSVLSNSDIMNFGNKEEQGGKLVARDRAASACGWLETSTSLESLLSEALPDKRKFFKEWLASLASPSVCISTIEDVQRLDPEDIGSLPVPPMVKGVFRAVLASDAVKVREQQLILDATKARAKAFLSQQKDRHMQPAMAGSKYFQDQKGYRLIATQEELAAGNRICARRIETWCKGERIILVGILKGAFMFMSDLCRALQRPYSVYFVEASSYKDGRNQGANMEINSDLASAKFCDAVTKAPHKVVLVDELLDNGKTMFEMKKHFLNALSATHTENDILTVCLMSKERGRDWPAADITGIPDLPDLWLVGYGLDDRGTKRGWSELFAIPKVKLVDTIEVEEVEKLISNLDDSAVLAKPLVFAGFELTCNHKQRYRVIAVEATNSEGALATDALDSGIQLTSKADVERVIAGVPTVKGKYEHYLHFSLIAENMELVAEDAIFSGNNTVYAEMRCKVREKINRDALRYGVAGIQEQ